MKKVCIIIYLIYRISKTKGKINCETNINIHMFKNRYTTRQFKYEEWKNLIKDLEEGTNYEN